MPSEVYSYNITKAFPTHTGVHRWIVLDLTVAIAAGVTMLPLYAASCNNILCYNQIGYEQRSWCRIERTMFASFCAPVRSYYAMNLLQSAQIDIILC